MLAFYLRISKADGEEEESNSIDSQRELLRQSLHRYGFSKEMVIEYIDDGYSGKNLNRPGIIRLFQDIEKGRIQAILVKDFSRFGRNYNEVSEYLERRFPKANIRFIAVNNGYDSSEQTNGSFSIFQNIFDDYYSEENAKKIKQALFQLKQEGKYMAPVAPYGYQKDLIQPYHLVIDPEAAEVVRLIFQLRCEGKSGGEIARYLNSKGILSPHDYKNGRKGEHIWQSEGIWRIIRNREYLGNLVFGKYHTVLTGSHKQKRVPTGQCVEIEGVHKAIIDQRTFELAQVAGRERERLKERKQEKKGNKEKKINYLKGLVICKGCGHKMKRKERQKPFFFCKYYYYNRNPLCLKTGIQEEWLLQIIWQVVGKQMGKDGVDRKNIYKEDIYKKYREDLQKRQKQWERKRKKIEKQQKMEQYLLYEKWKDGKICEADYKRERDNYQKRYAKKQKVDEEGNQRENGEKIEEYYEFFAGLLQEILIGVFINSNKQIEIKFRLKDII